MKWGVALMGVVLMGVALFILLQIGVMGLVEWEWIVTLATLEPKDVDYTDFVTTAKRLVKRLLDEVCILIVR